MQPAERPEAVKITVRLAQYPLYPPGRGWPSPLDVAGGINVPAQHASGHEERGSTSTSSPRVPTRKLHLPHRSSPSSRRSLHSLHGCSTPSRHLTRTVSTPGHRSRCPLRCILEYLRPASHADERGVRDRPDAVPLPNRKLAPDPMRLNHLSCRQNRGVQGSLIPWRDRRHPCSGSPSETPP